MTEPNQMNWQILTGLNVVTDYAEGSNRAEVSNIKRLRLAVRIGHALTIAIDKAAGKHHYTTEGYSYEDAIHNAEILDFRRGSGVYSETRPADRNICVTVEAEHHDRFIVSADLRNDYEDNPELHGERILYAGFVAGIESIQPRQLLELASGD